MPQNNSKASLCLDLPGLMLSCRLDGRHDSRLLRYLNAALADACEALNDGAGAAQVLNWSLGEGEVRLEIAADCSAATLARAARHVALLAGDEGGPLPAPALGPAQTMEQSAEARDAGVGERVELAPDADSVEVSPATEASQSSTAEIQPGQLAPAEKDMPPFADLDAAVVAMCEAVTGGAREDAAGRTWVIVRDAFGLEGPAQTHEQIGKSLDLSKQGVSQNLSRSLDRLKSDPLLAARLKATAAKQAEVFWDFLDEYCGGLVGGDELESLPRLIDQALAAPHAGDLAAWALCFQAGHLGGKVAVAQRRAALGRWLDEHGTRVGECRISARLDADEIGRVLAGLDGLVETWRLPQSLDFLAGQMGVRPDSLETALTWRGPGLKVMVEDGLVSSSRAGIQVRRAHRLALLMSVEQDGREHGLYDLIQDYARAFPDDPTDPKYIHIAIGEQRGAPHLFLPGAVTGWRGLYRGGPEAAERLMDLSAHAKANAEGRVAEEADTAWSNDARVLELLERHGPMSNVALGKLAEAEMDMAASLVGLSVHQSGRIVRVGPKIYALPEQRDALARGEELPAGMLEPEVLQTAAYGVRSGEQRFFFPCWSDKLEKRLREAAEQHAEHLSLRWGRTIDPDYNGEKLFGELRVTVKLAAKKAGLETVLSAALHLAEYGVVSVASLNLLGRSRAGAMSPDGASLLAALIALGVVDGEERWFNPHRPGPLHEQAIEALTVARFRVGDQDWNQPEAKALLKAAGKLGAEPEWLRKGSGEKIRGLVSA